MAWSSSDLDYMSLIAEANSSVAAAADETTASVPAAADETTASVAVRVPKPRGKAADAAKMIIELILAGRDVDYCRSELKKHYCPTTTNDAIAMYHPDHDGRHRDKGKYLHLVEKAKARAAKQEEEERKRAAEALREARSWGLYGSRMPPEEEAAAPSSAGPALYPVPAPDGYDIAADSAWVARQRDARGSS